MSYRTFSLTDLACLDENLKDILKDFMRYLLLTLFFISGCGSKAPVSERIASENGSTYLQESDSSYSEPSEDDDGTQAYVVVHKTTPLYFEKDIDGDYIQFITAKEHQRFESSIEKEERSIREAEKAKLKREREKRLEREKAELKKKRAAKKKKRLKKSKKKKKKKLTKKQKERAKKKAVLKRKNDVLKRERDKVRKLREKRKKAEGKVRSAEKRVERRFPDGNVTSFFTFRKLKSDGDWVQVETIPESVNLPHCHQEGLERVGNLKIRFWVRSTEIAPVVTRSHSVELAPGVSTRLLPGLGILEENGKAYVFVSGFKLEVDLESDVVGTSYVPVRGMDVSMTDTVFSPTAISKGLRFGRQRLPINPFFSKYVSQTLQVGSRNYAAFQSRCAEVFVRVGDGDIERGGPRKTARFGGGSFSDSERSISAGTKIKLPSGSEVGSALQPFPISNQEGNCFRLKVWKGNFGKREARLCTD